MPNKTLRVLIWAKTYPELSTRNTETVCTGGLLEDGTPVRLYPVPLRYLGTEQRYQLYDWIDVPAEHSRSDSRPESHTVVGDSIRRVSHVGTEKGTWRTRRELVFKDPSWHFGSVGELKAAQVQSGRSFGMVPPGSIEDVRLRAKPAKAKSEYDRKLAAIQSQADLFRAEYKELWYPDRDIMLAWRCAEPCPECTNNPHEMKVLDWGLLELARKDGWEAARTKLETVSNLDTHDFRLFLGNFKLHMTTFGIIGLWYPKRRSQLELL